MTNMTTDGTNNDDNEVRDRMRKRFQEMDDLQRKREEAGAAWVFVGYFGFLVIFAGLLMMLFFIGIIPLNLPVLVSIVV
ncbi:MAG: hypothetical protein ACFFF4_02960, partial [Candidatus Thorarchaeota archaeon]